MVSNNCTGRGIDRMAVVLDANIEVEVGLIGIFLMLVTLAPHLISTLYSFAAVSNISVIEDDLNQRKISIYFKCTITNIYKDNKWDKVKKIIGGEKNRRIYW